LVLIPLTEECKLLPSNGIYAVSYESDSRKSKGMAIINEVNSDKSEVLLHLFDNEPCPLNTSSTVLFHKKIHGAINLRDLKSSTPRIRSAVNEISELIY
jgi:FAD synthase